MTDAELRDAAVAELELTTAGWRKGNGQPNYPSGTAPASSHWGKALSLLAQIGTTPTPTPPPTPGASGVPMPIGDISGWHQVFTDDFTTDVPLGQFPQAVAAKWFAYPYPWKEGGMPWITNDPGRTISCHDGVMDIWCRQIGSEYLVGAPLPRVNGPAAYLPGASPANFPVGNLYGRYAARFRADNFPGYKVSWLLWPDSNVWPRDGEIDFPEANMDGNVFAFMHRQGGTSGGDQDAYNSGVALAPGWHTVVVEWLASRCTFILDGVKIGESTSRIPSSPMHWVLQNGGRFDQNPPPAGAQGHILVDWVVAYVPA